MEYVSNVVNQLHRLTYGHVLQWTHYQAVIDLTFDPICHSLVFLSVLSHMDEQLREGVATNREGMYKQGARHEAFALEQLQQQFPTIQTPARPQEVFHLVKKIIIKRKIVQFQSSNS